MNQVQFKSTVLLVNDINISRKFYQNLFSLEIEYDFGENISFKNAFALWERNHAETRIFGTRRVEEENIQKDIELYFETDNIDSIWSIIQAQSIDVIHNIHEEPWGQRTARFFDPDGNIVEIGERMDSVIIRLSKMGLTLLEISEKTGMSINQVKNILYSD